MNENRQEKIRINKYIAMCSICSRRDADKLIEQEAVTINGRKARAGDCVGAEDTVFVRGKQIKAEEKKVVLAFYKPRGVVCTERDRHAEKMIKDMISYPVRVTYAGRLDKESEGLLLLTNDGNLIQHMMKGSENHEKEYVVRVNKEVTEAFLEKMGRGVRLTELDRVTKPCKIRQTGKYTFQIILTQGINRQIRRMCKELGYEVRELKRIRVVNIELAGLVPGKFRELSQEEQKALYHSCGISP